MKNPMRRVGAALLITIALTACAQIVPFEAGEGERARSERNCSFKARGLPDDIVVVGAAMWGGRPLGIQIDRSGHEATTFEVAVHADKPVALFLSAYEPTVWNIGWSKGTRVVAVYATGHHRQAVAGLPKDTPVIVASHETDGPCGHADFTGGQPMAWMNPISMQVFGFPITQVYDRANRYVFDIVLSNEPKRPYETSTASSVMSFREPNTPLVGQTALQDAEKKGLLRRATTEDAEQLREWLATLRAASNQPVKETAVIGATRSAPEMRIRLPTMPLYNGYVVLKTFTYPVGLVGSNRATFIVPSGVPLPTGIPGESAVYDMNPGGNVPFCGTIECGLLEGPSVGQRVPR